MLVLTRRRDEQIVIGEPGPNQITIVVQRIVSGRVSLAIEAPRDIPILRGEIARFPVDGEALTPAVPLPCQATREQLLAEQPKLDRPLHQS